MAANDVPCCEPMFWVYLVISVGLVSFAGLMSGLTLGLMSLSLVDVEILAKAGQPHERKNAAKILPIVKNQHLLLCTLLIWNSLAMEALPIFLDALLPAWGAILISVTLILAFGEIIPQSICSRYGLSVGAKLSGVVRLLMILIFPLSYPISKVLDCILGKGHSALLRRAELKMFVDMHGNEAGKGGELTHDETTIITGALDMTQKTVKVAMTPISDVFSLSVNSKLDENTMELIISKGHSRIPIYSDSPTNIIGLILVKNLIKARPEHETLVKDVTIRNIPRVKDSLPLYDILNQFQKGHSHMAVVVRSKKDIKESTEYITAKTNTVAAAINGGYNGRVLRNSPSSYSETMKKYWKKREWKDDCETTSLRASEEVVGIITLEDVIEELLQEEILDETDEYVDVHNMININMLPLRSPVSSYNPSPILRSPITPWNRSPIPRPTLSASPRDSTTASPIRYGGSAASSPNLQVLRKSYEKMQKPSVP